MKTSIPILTTLLFSFLFTATLAQSPAVPADSVESVEEKNPFEVFLYMDAQWRINVLVLNQPHNRVTIRLRDPKNEIVHREVLRQTRVRCRYDFTGAEVGEYQLEISDGQHRQVRRIEIVQVPGVAPQQYITYGPQIGH